MSKEYEISFDKALWNNFRAGDEESFSNIYRAYVQPLYKYGLKFTNDKELVLDCIQEVFVDLFIHRKNLGETNNIKLYLFICLKRKIIHSYKESSLVKSFQDDEFPLLLIPSTETNPSDFDDEKEKVAELNKALKMLSPRQREAVYLRFVSELKYEEICQILDLNYQSVRNLIHRAIEKLRKILICSIIFLLHLL